MSSSDEPKTGSHFEDLGRKLDQGIGHASKTIEQESDKLISYLNDEVVPAIRNRSSSALRMAAEKLSRLAESMEKHGSK